jgi:hypothetical protein
VVPPVLDPARQNYGAAVRPSDVAPTARKAKTSAVTPATIAPSSSAAIAPMVTSSASISPTAAVTPTAVAAFVPVRPVYLDSVYFSNARYLFVRGLRKQLPYSGYSVANSCIITGPCVDGARFAIFWKQSSTGRNL